MNRIVHRNSQADSKRTCGRNIQAASQKDQHGRRGHDREKIRHDCQQADSPRSVNNREQCENNQSSAHQALLEIANHLDNFPTPNDGLAGQANLNTGVLVLQLVKSRSQTLKYRFIDRNADILEANADHRPSEIFAVYGIAQRRR